MKKNKVLIFLILITVFHLNCIKASAQLPFEGINNDVIYGPEDYIYNRYLKKDEPFMRYCLSGEKVSDAVSLTEGTVQSIQYSFNPNFYMTYVFESYEEAVKSLEKNNVDTKYINMTLCISISKSEKLYYIGIEPDTINVAKGQSIEKGSYLGKIGYGIKDVGEKNLTISYEVNNKLADITQLPGASSTKYDTVNKDSRNEAADAKKNVNTGEKNTEGSVIKESQVYEIDYRNDCLSIDELNDIYAIFYQSLTEGHPSLYAYTGKEHLDAAFKELKSKLNKPLRRNELFLYLNEIIHLIKDNHTYITKSYLVNEDMPYEIPYALPVKLGFINGKCYVLDIYSASEQLNIGDEITAINDESIDIVYKKLYKAAGTADGNIKGFSDIYMLKESPFLGSGFKYLYDIVYMPKQGDPFVIKTSHGKAAYTLGSLEIPEKKPDDYKYIETTTINDTLVLEINTMSLTDEHFDIIEKAFKKPNTKNIIIDLRKNMGGSSESIGRLFRLLYTGPFVINKRYEVRSNKPYEFNKYSMNLSNDIECFTDYVYDDKADCFYIDRQTNPAEFTETHGENLCEGKNIYVLTSELTGSAACVFSSMIQYHKVGLILGREGSGGVHHMSGLKFSEVRLGESGLLLQVPLVKIIPNYISSNVEYGKGVIPDKIISYTLEEEISNNDLTLTAALEYIASTEEQKELKSNAGTIIGAACLCVLIAVGFGLRKQIRKNVLSHKASNTIRKQG
ncbi:MAG: S41 family peptidase [Bacillota bacterium]